MTETIGINVPRVGIIVGSNRKESLNRRLADALVALGSERMQALNVRIDDLPMYNADLDPKA